MSERGNRKWRDDKKFEDNLDTPPHSRLFVVCGKQTTTDDLETAFSQFGTATVYMPKDRNTGSSKGIAFIKYVKTSEAARAMEELDGTKIGVERKPLKVIIASNKDGDENVSEEGCKRLFIINPDAATEEDLRNTFSTFGKLESVYLHKNRVTNENKGLAYITFKTFFNAALAYEECDRKYKAVFAKPRDDLKRSRNNFESGSNYAHEHKNVNVSVKDNLDIMQYNHSSSVNNLGLMMKANSDGYTAVKVLCSPQLSQHHIEKLFNVVPGMERCQYTVDYNSGFGSGVIIYDNPSAAAHAVERLHGFEYPLGEKLIVRPDDNLITKVANDLSNVVKNFKQALSSGNQNPDIFNLVDAISQASSLIKCATSSQAPLGINNTDRNDSFCNVKLPPRQPLADPNSQIVKRCFIVCKPHPPPKDILTDVFCRFGDMINVFILHKKHCGFVKYASTRAANNAIETLNGATVAGSLLKVSMAEPEKKVLGTEKQIKRLKLDPAVTDVD